MVCCARRSLVCFSTFIVFLVCTLVAPLAVADILELKDGNLIECKYAGMEKGGSGEILIVTDEQGKRTKYSMRRVKGFTRGRPSWEVLAEKRKWYAAKVKKLKDDWRAHERFARRCYGKRLQEEATKHYLRAYELRKPQMKQQDQKNLLKLAQWLEDCELFDEAQAERQRVYELRKAKLPTDKADAKAHAKLADWCRRFELLAEAAEQYDAAIAIQPQKKTYKVAVEKVRRQLTIPMDPGFYRATRVRVAAAARYIKKQQDSDGGIGSDINEAGVHGKRGMTALATMALLADWDFGVLSGKYDADVVPEEILEAVDYLLGFEPSKSEDLRGNDVWGPIFALDLLVQCYKRPQFGGKDDGPTAVEGGNRKKAIAAEIKRLIEILKNLQRSDGGWMYYHFVPYSASFVTASAIVSLVNASNAGFRVERGMIDRAVEQVQSMRQGHGTFTYSKALTQGPVGACARSPVCELALKLTGNTKDTSLKYAIDIFFKNRHILEGLKGSARTHIGAGKTAPYYLLFAHYWTARAIKHLDRKLQRKYLDGLGGGLVAYQEGDATFGDWTGTADYKVYGTAFAALTLYYIASLQDGVGEFIDPPPRNDDAEEEEGEDEEDDVGDEGKEKKSGEPDKF